MIQIALLLTFAQLSLSNTGWAAGTSDDDCGHNTNLAKIETAAVQDIRARIAAEKDSDAKAFTFHFAPILRREGQADFAVYFERVANQTSPGIDAPDSRHGMIAEFAVTPGTCQLEFKKMGLLIAAASKSSAFASTPAQPCETPRAIAAVHAAIVHDLTVRYHQIAPPAVLTNFAFTKITRVPGTADIAVMVELSRPGIATQMNLARFSVDARTCQARYVSAPPLVWPLISYTY